MSNSSYILRRIFSGAIITVGVAGIIIFGYRLLSKSTQVARENPFEFDLEQYQKIDPDLIWYEEVQRIEVAIEKTYGLAAGPADKIYVTGNKILIIFNNNGTEEHRVILEETAKCIALEDNGDIYLGMTDHVEVYESSGARKDIWPGLGNLALITSIAVTPGYVFVADAGNHIVLRFDKSGKLLGRVGDKDETRGIPGYILPSPYFDVAAGNHGSIWVANNGRHSMENYSYDGDLLSSWGKPSMSIENFSGCCNPVHFAVLPDGSFVTSEKGLVRVKVHDPSGEFVCAVAGAEQFSAGTIAPDLAVDSQGRIMVLDEGAGVVRLFFLKDYFL